VTFGELSKLQDDMVPDPSDLEPDDFVLFLLHYCVNCQRMRDTHVDGKCLFSETTIKTAGIRAAARYKKWVRTWEKKDTSPDQSFWDEPL
jgi:hypothetical protein